MSLKYKNSLFAKLPSKNGLVFGYGVVMSGLDQVRPIV